MRLFTVAIKLFHGRLLNMSQQEKGQVTLSWHSEWLSEELVAPVLFIMYVGLCIGVAELQLLQKY